MFTLLGSTLFAMSGGASPVEAQGPRVSLPPSGTNLHEIGGSDTASTVLSFNCSYLTDGPQPRHPRKASCRIATTTVTRPSAAQVAERLSDLDAPDKQEQLKAGFSAVCSELTAREAPAAAGPKSAHRVYYEMLSKACAANDFALGKDALRYEAKEIWANTCEAFNYGAREHEFDMVDESTWRAMDGAAVGGAASIKTIWRKKGSPDFAAWSFKQVTSGDPTCAPAPFRECAEDSTSEWSREAPMTVTGCQYFK